MENARKIVGFLVILVVIFIFLGGLSYIDCAPLYGRTEEKMAGIFEPKIVKELSFLYKYGNVTNKKITVGMTKEQVKNSWGDVFWIKKLPLSYNFGPGYAKLYGADELWEYPKEGRYFREQSTKFSSKYGFFYALLFKGEVLIKILEMKQLIK